MEYDNELINKISQSVDLLSYVERNFILQKKGNYYFTNCPFHIDKTPSLEFSPEHNSFHCFSCGKSGRIIKYLMLFENLNFDEAINKASKLAKIDLTNEPKSKTILFLRNWRNNKNKVMNNEIIRPILNYADFAVFKKEPVPEWLEEGISEEAMDFFDIRIDEKANRIVYPVFDGHNNFINVKGRTRYKNYKDLKLPKYINYKKIGQMDYLQCLEKTLPYIREKKEVIIFEGIKSVMKAYDYGFKNCVSAEKHSLTADQIILLIKLKVNIVFAYDSDVSYSSKQLIHDLSMLKHITNVFIIQDTENLLGGKTAKNAPVDLGKEVWLKLYNQKKKVV